MNPSARLYNCLRCHKQVLICRRCDRGHRFCGDACSRLSRRDCQRRATERYQRSPQGRTNNARRQQRFRERQQLIDQQSKTTKVTHHGSTLSTSRASLQLGRWPDRYLAINQGSVGELRCHCCACLCDPFLRRHFLHSSSRSPPY